LLDITPNENAAARIPPPENDSASSKVVFLAKKLSSEIVTDHPLAERGHCQANGRTSCEDSR
jgi:hypothetical protein